MAGTADRQDQRSAAGRPRPRRFSQGFARRNAPAHARSAEWAGVAFDLPFEHEGGRSPATRKRDRFYRRVLAGADIAAAVVALVVCLPILGNGDTAQASLLLGLPLLVLVAKLLGLYDRDELLMRKSTLDEAPALFQVATLVSLVLWIVSGPIGLGRLGGDQVLVTWMVLFLSLVGTRVLARGLAGRTTSRERCLLLGDPAMCARARAKIEASSTIKVDVVGEISSPQIGEEEVPMSRLSALAAHRDVQRVIVAPRSTDHGDALDLVRGVKALGLKVSVLPRLLEVIGSSVVVDDLDGLRVLGVRRFGLTRSSTFVKRSFDVLGAGAGLAALLPLFAWVAVVIKLGSKGPILFRQPRIGKDGCTFEMLKFRTMVPDAESRKDGLRDLNEASGLFKIADDPRITRAGRLLRRTSLDELPQLLNVLRGDMSLVGPRPLVVEDDAQIEGWDRRRLHLTPGMTGPWQVLGSARLPLHEMVKLDYLYVATWSLWNDVKLLLRTAGFVIRRQGL